MPSLRIECYGVTADKCIKKLNLLALFCGYSEVTVKFSQCYTDVPKVTVHSQYPKVKNQMLQCYSVTAYPRAKSQRNMLIIISCFVGL